MTTNTASEPEAEQLQEKIAEFLSLGGTLAQAQDHDENYLESLYQIGHNRYSNTHYRDAKMIFGYLAMQNHREPRYMNAYASSLQMLGDFKEAIKFYSIASLLDIEDPLPTFYTAECMMALDFIAEAREALGFVVEQCNAPRHFELKARAEAMLALLNPSRAAGATD